jgi:hypothetical protein
MEETCCAEEACDPREPRITSTRGETPPSRVPTRERAVIRSVENGFILEIGCKTFVAKTWKEASDGLGEYWDDPIKAEKKFSKDK